MITLKLTGPALKLNVFPVVIVLVLGTMEFGLLGVLLADGAAPERV